MNIRIYNGIGVSKEGLIHTFNTLSQCSPKNYFISYISAEEIINGEWISNTNLLVIGGGADLHYKKYLDGKGNEQIQKFINEGGGILGICAGSYYCGSYVEFAKSSPKEILGNRELSIYKGTIVGPVLTEYYYNSDKGALAAKINLLIKSPYKETNIFYNGGGYFLNAENIPNTKIIANYHNNKAAIVLCNYGRGKAILSSVHFEYDPYIMKYSKLREEIIASLKVYNESRIFLVKYILDSLLI
jgi:glutamine amidotransferase-like uncharacterized protein